MYRDRAGTEYVIQRDLHRRPTQRADGQWRKFGVVSHEKPSEISTICPSGADSALFLNL